MPTPPASPEPRPKFSKGPDQLLLDTPFLKVVQADFTMPDGKVFSRQVVRHLGAAVVVPFDEGDVLLVRQYRAAFEEEILELPAGKLDVAGEDSLAAARRELAEETGMAAGNLELLSAMKPTPGFCDEIAYVYLATDLTPTDRDIQSGEEEFMTIERWPLDAALDAVVSGEISDAKTIAGLFLAARRL